MDTTLNYYNEKAGEFVQDTSQVEFTAVQDKFLEYVTAGGYILDFGCGSGRDTIYFLSKDFTVNATDGSAEMCRIASENTGIQVEQLLFTELSAVELYDGIWACASILHLPKPELRDVLERMLRALVPEGYVYASFKYGTFEGVRNGRYFTDFTAETFLEFVSDIPAMELAELWISHDVRPGREEEKWLNVIIQKVE